MAVPARLDRWRKDPLVNAAILLCGAASVLLFLALLQVLSPSDRSRDRGQVLYWLLLVPVAVWISATMNFAAWAIRALFFVSLASVLCAVGLLIVAQTFQVRGDASHASAFAVLAAIAACAAALLSRARRFRDFAHDASSTSAPAARDRT